MIVPPKLDVLTVHVLAVSSDRLTVIGAFENDWRTRHAQILVEDINSV